MQELALVEEAVKTKLIVDSVAWLLSQRSLINKRTQSVLPVVRDRQALVATLRGVLGDLGLKRRTKAGPTLDEYLSQRSSGTSAASAVELDTSGSTPVRTIQRTVACCEWVRA